MTDFSAKSIDKMFEYNLWANTTIIKLCQQLDDEQLAFEIDGAHGGIRQFLAHMIFAESYYIWTLTGTSFWEDNFNLAKVPREWVELPLETLLDRAQLTGNKLIEVASKTNPDVRHDATPDDATPFPYDFTFFNWSILAQAVSHGVEHRTHIKVLLSQLGIEHIDFSVWSYMHTLQ